MADTKTPNRTKERHLASTDTIKETLGDMLKSAITKGSEKKRDENIISVATTANGYLIMRPNSGIAGAAVAQSWEDATALAYAMLHTIEGEKTEGH